MKKFLLALTAVASMTGAASAADLAARPYTKAPVAPAVIASWTGCYLGAGGGGGIIRNNSYLITNPGGVRASTDLTQGGDGWLVTVQGGCDYQFAGTNWVVGAFADADWTNIRGDHTGDNPGRVGLSATARQNLDWQWSVGGRVGYTILPTLLTYVSGGFTQAKFAGVSYVDAAGALTGDKILGQTYNGWFVGTGDEYALNFLPGLFWKTEYRYSQFQSRDVPVIVTATGLSNGFSERTHFSEHSIRSELVYRFNWGGPAVAKY